MIRQYARQYLDPHQASLDQLKAHLQTDIQQQNLERKEEVLRELRKLLEVESE